MSGKSTIEIWLDRYGAKKLTEKSLGRLFRDMGLGGTYALITAYRRELSLDENIGRNEKLAHDLRSAGLAAAPTQSLYSDTLPDGAKEELFEQSWFVWGIPKARAMKIARKYEQKSLLVGCKDTGVYCVNMDGTEKTIGRKLTLKVLAKAYKKIKGERVKFVGLAYIPRGFFDTLAWMGRDLGERNPLRALNTEVLLELE